MNQISKNKPFYGVNLGGWLVLEKWMTPGLFAGYAVDDERSFMREADSRQRLRRHRETFIAEDDIRWLAEHGIDIVRVPVGYGLFGNEAPYEACVDRLDWLIECTAQYDIQVIIDLHRAPGSPDGHDTGGEIVPFAWFTERALREQTLDVLERIAQRYGRHRNVWGIELLNEPRVSLRRLGVLRRFYREAYAKITPHMRPGMAVIFNDGFHPLWLNGVIRSDGVHPPVMDVHFYHFSVPFDGWRSLAGHMRKVRRRLWMLAWLHRRQDVIIGEWSGVIAGEKMRNVPREQQGPFEDRYIREQQRVHQYAEGQFYWNYTTQEPGIWNYRSLVEMERVNAPGVKGATIEV
jgi:glucan 1,3-beta-glucosidase